MDTPLETQQLEIKIPADQLLGHWVVVCEVIDPEGELNLHRLSSPGLPTYVRTGMLQEALDDMAWEREDDD